MANGQGQIDDDRAMVGAEVRADAAIENRQVGRHEAVIEGDPERKEMAWPGRLIAASAQGVDQPAKIGRASCRERV